MFALLALSACDTSKTEQAEQSSAQASSSSSPIVYPETRKDETQDTYFGDVVADPYRWLEDDRSEETGNWVDSQNKVTFDYLESIPFRKTIADKVENLINYEKVTAPFTEGEYTYIYKNDGLQNQYVLYRKKGDGELEVFIDPNTFSEDGTISMSGLTFSKDTLSATLAAYQISKGGSDWREIVIINV